MGYGKLYQVNRDHPIFAELRQIVIKMLGATNAVRDVLLGNPAVEAAAIFGSVAAGTDRRTGRLSDIDLLVVFTDASVQDVLVSSKSQTRRFGIGLEIGNWSRSSRPAPMASTASPWPRSMR